MIRFNTCVYGQYLYIVNIASFFLHHMHENLQNTVPITHVGCLLSPFKEPLIHTDKKSKANALKFDGGNMFNLLFFVQYFV